MATNPDDTTIVAIATPPGRGSIGVVRVSGPLAKKIAYGVLGRVPAPRYAAYLDFYDEQGHTIDRGIALFFPGPHSYTGEDVLELQGHGGTVVMQCVLKRCLALGARLAEPGEFTRRAYLNDKLDLAQAEAVADLIEASTLQAAQSAMRSLSGEFSAHIHALRDELVDLRLYVEACLDFPEEDIDQIHAGHVVQRLSLVSDRLNRLLASARQGSLLREGIHVVLVGQPNVGKSSLMNQLSGEEIAIVTAIAGTTRDTLKNEIQIEGVPVHIIDTAGLRETGDEVERAGIARTWKAAESAQIALILVDVAHGITDTESRIIERLHTVPHRIWIHNKIDLIGLKPELRNEEDGTHIYLSAKTGAGVNLLRSHLLRLAGWQAAGEGVYMARERHVNALNQVRTCLQRAAENLGQLELLAEELRLAQEALNTITGEFTTDDLLGEIFGRFCIGK
ncbi:MAG: tRNA uridine-5-carboxymethylaminomethyl(34) synthesis GTPase MnmE [Methylophilaceae bacterium]|nr:tRNA uridine-5-carboxymethylaminomethyl(34) synthesis GTPase MnmE [Methylophilaceae bacterium]